MTIPRSSGRTRLPHETLLRLLDDAAKCRSNHRDAVRARNLDRQSVKFQAGRWVVDIDYGEILLQACQRPTALESTHIVGIRGSAYVLDHSIFAQINGRDAAIISPRHPIPD